MADSKNFEHLNDESELIVNSDAVCETTSEPYIYMNKSNLISLEHGHHSDSICCNLEKKNSRSELVSDGHKQQLDNGK